MRRMLSACAQLVRRHDPDRFLCALFAPAARRETLFVLYAFNHELARAREVASNPLVAMIRLQWWREVVEGQDKRHEVATPLTAALAAGELDQAALLALIDARELEAEAGLPDMSAWRAYLDGAQGGVQREAGRVLGATDLPALTRIGAAYGAGGILRSVAMLARHERCLLPEDGLAEAGFAPETVGQGGPALQALLERLAAEALGWTQGLRLDNASALLGVLGRRDLKRAGIPREGARGVGDRLAVARRGLWRG